MHPGSLSRTTFDRSAETGIVPKLRSILLSVAVALVLLAAGPAGFAAAQGTGQVGASANLVADQGANL
jgi:hypothetical protein